MTGASRPLVDVGVVTWNTGELTANALRRLLDSDQGCDLRLLVRDNGSTDGTVETLRRLVPESEVDAGKENLGFAAGMNRLFARSRAPWFFVLNSDAWPDEGTLATLVEVSRRERSAAAVAPRIERPDGTLEHSTYPFPSIKLAWKLAFRGARIDERLAEQMMLEGFWMHDKPRRVDWAIGATLLIPREAIESVGTFDERFFMYGEDVEWCWRAHRLGWSIEFEPSAVVRHVGNVSGEQNYGSTRTAAYIRNSYRFFRREHALAASILYRALNIAGVTRLYLRAARRRNREEAAFWKAHLRAHLSTTTGPDRPPTTVPNRSREPSA